MSDKTKDRHPEEKELEELLEEGGGAETVPEVEEEPRRKRKAPLIAWALFLVLPCYAVDQLVKSLVVRKIMMGTGFTVVPGFMDIIHVRNTGAAFGMLQGIPEHVRTWFFLGVTIVAFVAMFVVFSRAREKSALLKAVFCLIIAGALGNLTDRFVYGEVVDFLSVYIGSFRWPTFNLADTWITLGMLGLLFHIFTMPPEEE